MLNTFLPFFKFSLFLILTLVSGTSYASDPIKGGELYVKHCADCHGISGAGVMPSTPNFSQNEGLMQSDAYLLDSISRGKNAMPLYKNILSDQEILDVIAYLRTLN